MRVDARVAALGSRSLARLFDIIVQGTLAMAITIALLLVLVVLGAAGLVVIDNAIISTIAIVTTVAVYIGYPVFTETVTRGRTAGKYILGLRVVRDDGGPVTFRHALTRGLVGAAVEWPGLLLAPLTWLVSILAMLSSPLGKRIGDHAAGTIVVHERTPAAWGWVPQMPPQLVVWAGTLDLTGLSDDLALAVRHYLARSRSIKEPHRTQLGLRLAREVAAVTNPPPPPDAPGWAYLAAVQAERHRRSMLALGAARARTHAVWPDLVAATAVPSQPTASHTAAR